MRELSESIVWFNRALYASLGLFVILAAILPLGLSAESAVMPDILMAMTFAWIIRRPATAPVFLVFLVALFADILMMRPLGLWAGITVLVGEFARSQVRPLREQMFVMEWLLFAGIFALALLLNNLMLSLAFSPRPNLDLTVNHILLTAAMYPIIVGIMHWIFHIRAPQAAARSERLGRVT